ncbi:MAG: hypothetical protein GC153_04930 [Alphaproteobacteria bacterium]|nr:hypothetical protein [Alphaproteobacteria bacterium]
MGKIPARLLVAILLAGAAGCATLSPKSRVESELASLGMSQARAGCIASELDRRLDGQDMRAVADFLGGLRRNDDDDVLGSLSQIQNPRAVAAIASAGISCTIGR